MTGRTGLVLSLGDRDHLLRPWVPPRGVPVGATPHGRQPLPAPLVGSSATTCLADPAYSPAAHRGTLFVETHHWAQVAIRVSTMRSQRRHGRPGWACPARGNTSH